MKLYYNQRNREKICESCASRKLLCDVKNNRRAERIIIVPSKFFREGINPLTEDDNQKGLYFQTRPPPYFSVEKVVAESKSKALSTSRLQGRGVSIMLTHGKTIWVDKILREGFCKNCSSAPITPGGDLAFVVKFLGANRVGNKLYLVIWSYFWHLPGI